jgi:hypothetical protein
MNVKTKPKRRRWRCQGILGDVRCKVKALFERKDKLGSIIFKIPLKLKLCLSCDRMFSALKGK